MNKIAKIASKSKIKPELSSVLFRGDKIVATDSFRLVEVTTEDKGLDILIPAKDLKAGDTVNADGTITRKDLLVFEPQPLVGSEFYPDYKQIMPTDDDLKDYTEVQVNADYLSELLQAMPRDKNNAVTLRVHKTDDKKVIYITSDNGKGLVMPLLK